MKRFDDKKVLPLLYNFFVFPRNSQFISNSEHQLDSDVGPFETLLKSGGTILFRFFHLAFKHVTFLHSVIGQTILLKTAWTATFHL